MFSLKTRIMGNYTDEKNYLISNDDEKNKDYGAAMENNINNKKKNKKKKKSEQPKSVSFLKLFRYSTSVEKCLLIGGFICNVIHGASFPIMTVIFGQMTQTFISHSKRGYQENDDNVTMNLQASLQNLTHIAFNETSRMPSVDPDNNLEKKLATFSIYYVYIGICVLVAVYLKTTIFSVTSERQIHRMREDFFYQLLRQDIKWFDEQTSGSLAMKLNDDLERVREGIGDKLNLFIQYLSTFFSGILVSVIISWRLTVVVLSVMPFLAISTGYMGKVISSSTAREQEKYGEAGGMCHEALSCIRTVMSFCGQKYEHRRYAEALNKGIKISLRKAYVVGTCIGFQTLVQYGSAALIFWYGAKLVVWDLIQGGKVFSVYFAMMIGSSSLGQALNNLQDVITAKSSARSIFQIIDSKPEIDSYSAAGLQPSQYTTDIEFRNVSFHYQTRPTVKIINNLSMTIKEGETIALCGESGSGKSTIVSLLLRFYNPDSGKIMIGNHKIQELNVRWLRMMIGVVSQEPVLFNCSIAENIQYGRTDVAFPELVDAAKNANAHDFIVALPDGYNTIVGERGAQLSGGQKQRIAIARALVRDPKILLLDEATSALDAESEAVVQEALDKAGRGRTTIIIAHRLSTVQNADVIFAMEKGQIVEHGKHLELMSKKGLYHKLVTNQIFETAQAENAPVPITPPARPLRKSLSMSTGSLRRLSSLDDITASNEALEKILQTPNITKVMQPFSYENNQTDSETEENEPENTGTEWDNVKIPSIWRIAKACLPDLWPLTYGTIAAIVAGGILPTYAVFFAEIFHAFTYSGKQLLEATFFWSMMFLILAFISFITMTTKVVGMVTCGDKLSARLRQKSYLNILRQPAGWFDDSNHATGKLETRLAADGPMIKMAAGHRLHMLIQAFSTMTGSIIIAYVYGWQLALLLTAVIPILVITGIIKLKIRKSSNISHMTLMAESGKVVSEGLDNIRTVQALTQEPAFCQKYMSGLIAPYRENVRIMYKLSVLTAVSESFIFMMYAMAFRFGAYLVEHGEMEPVDIYRVFFALTFSAVSVTNTFLVLQDYEKAKVAAAMMFHIIDTVPQIDNLSKAGLKPEIKGHVTLNCVHFKYPTRPDVQVLRGLNLNVKQGQTLALVGPSGCGKSTVVSLIQRFYDPHYGDVEIDGNDIRTINIQHLRKHIAVVSQEPLLFNDTIRNNIIYGMDKAVGTCRITEAAKIANAHNFILELPDGYETIVGEKGTQLSGGQKQRISIARALVRDPKILLLDESTSALDTESEKLVQDALDKARCGRTCIVIAHRLSTIQGADCIAVIDRGFVVEKGTHQQLLSAKGVYYKLTEKQRIRE